MTADDVRVQLCRKMLDEGAPQRTICSLLHMSASTVSAIKKAGDAPFEWKKCGRKPCVTEEMKNFIEMTLSADATITDDEMRRFVRRRFGADISVSSVRRTRNLLKFVYRPPRICQFLTEDQISLRLEFCRWVLENQAQLTNLVFSDESRFEKTPDNKWRRIRRGTINDNCFYKKTKFTEGVMVWGAVSVDFRTRLMRCSKGVNATEYIEIMRSSEMIEKLNEKFGEGQWMFVQDGAPAHTAKTVTDYLTSQKVKVMPGWPPNSPDLNPIEMLWGVLKKKIAGKMMERNAAFTMLEESWSSIADEVINKLVNSFVERCQLVLRLGGASATPYLASHRTDTPPTALPAPLWTPAEDQELERLYDSHGPRWAMFSERLNKSRQIIRHRWMMQDQIMRNLTCEPSPPLPPIRSIVPDELIAVPDDIATFLRDFGADQNSVTF